MTTSISLHIDDDEKFREEYILSIENAKEEEVILGILRVAQSALNVRKQKLEEFMKYGFESVEKFKETMGENRSSDPFTGQA